jgi:hypothetical protein
MYRGHEIRGGVCMKVYVVILALAVSLLLSAAICFGGPAPKATGAGEFTRTEDGMEIEARFSFEAHGEYANRPAKGWFKYRDSMGNEFTIDVQCVTVQGNDAFFSGPVAKTNMDDWEVMWLLLWVEDGGSPAEDNDTLGGEMFDYDPGCSPNLYPNDYWPVTNGNIVVH